eukprot:3005896-Rhodomonas_salina.1
MMLPGAPYCAGGGLGRYDRAAGVQPGALSAYALAMRSSFGAEHAARLQGRLEGCYLPTPSYAMSGTEIP